MYLSCRRMSQKRRKNDSLRNVADRWRDKSSLLPKSESLKKLAHEIPCNMQQEGSSKRSKSYHSSSVVRKSEKNVKVELAWYNVGPFASANSNDLPETDQRARAPRGGNAQRQQVPEEEEKFYPGTNIPITPNSIKHMQPLNSIKGDLKGAPKFSSQDAVHYQSRCQNFMWK